MSMLPWASRLCSIKNVHSAAVRTMKTTSRVLTMDSKTPIQKYGWQYLTAQKALKRPLSPCIGIYQMQMTWGLSGLSRISASIMGGVLVVGGVGFATLPINFTQFVDFLKNLNLPSVVTAPFKFIIAFPIIFHIFNGLRFLGYEFAVGAELATIYKTGYATLILTTLIALFVVFQAEQAKRQAIKL
uniref:Succinate dehydrogenase cytochrome b560 subunit, mitochondrial n=1 Tax=Rhabditophanes sp. KR3021 TaxID=114890 RepID=A0AC35U8J6_9BILA